MTKTLTFRTLSGQRLIAKIKNAQRKTLGPVMSSAANRFNLAGSYEALDKNSEVISPTSPLDDLPDNEEIVIASELTPA